MYTYIPKCDTLGFSFCVVLSLGARSFTRVACTEYPYIAVAGALFVHSLLVAMLDVVSVDSEFGQVCVAGWLGGGRRNTRGW